jgi:hypothetical protein
MNFGHWLIRALIRTTYEIMKNEDLPRVRQELLAFSKRSFIGHIGGYPLRRDLYLHPGYFPAFQSISLYLQFAHLFGA